jgi:hypothetical protein
MPLCLMLLRFGENGGYTVDHCHADDYVRGLLCHRCNTLEGQWREAERLGVREYLNGGGHA